MSYTSAIKGIFKNGKSLTQTNPITKTGFNRPPPLPKQQRQNKSVFTILDFFQHNGTVLENVVQIFTFNGQPTTLLIVYYSSLLLEENGRMQMSTMCVRPIPTRSYL